MPSALRGIGYDAEEARIIADHVIDAALCGYEYSGLPRSSTSPSSQHFRRRAGPMRCCARPRCRSRSTAATMSACWRCTTRREAAIGKAAAHGIALVGVNNSWMSGRSAYYVEMIARAGLVGIHTVAQLAAGGAARRHPAGARHQPDRVRFPVVARADRDRHGHLGVHGDRAAVPRAPRRAAARGRGDRRATASRPRDPARRGAARCCRSAATRASGWRW